MAVPESFLLFLDSFSHDKHDEPHADVVQFKKPAVLMEARVLPFGVAVQSENQVHLGATNPASFDLTFYTSSLPSPNDDNPCYEEVGRLKYDERSRGTSLTFSSMCTTLSLVIRGNYSTLTLAIFGVPQGHPPANALLPTPMGAFLQPMYPHPASNVYAPVFGQPHPSMVAAHHLNALAAGQHHRYRPLEPGEIYDDRRGRPHSQSPMGSRGRGGARGRGRYGAPGNELDLLVPGQLTGTEPGEIAEEGEDGEIQDNEMVYEEISSDDLSEFEEAMEFTVIDAEYDVSDDQLLSTLTFEFRPADFVEVDHASPKLLLDPALTLQNIDTHLLTLDLESAADSAESSSTKAFSQNWERCRSASQMLLRLMEKVNCNGLNAEWVQGVERILDLLPSALAYLQLPGSGTSAEEVDAVVTALLRWLDRGLDLDAALQHQSDENVFIMRHLKMGVALAGVLASQESQLATKALEAGLQCKLLKLLNSAHMATSMKLQVLRALDRSTRLHVGMATFVAKDATGSSAYRQLLEFMLKKQTARVMAAASALVSKLHVYQLMLEVEQAMLELCALTSPAPGEMTNAEELLTELLAAYNSAETSVAQPRRGLPCMSTFDSKPTPYDPYPDLFHMLDHIGLLKLFHKVMSIGNGNPEPVWSPIRNVVLQWLTTLLSSQKGLLFLAARWDTSMLLLKALMLVGNEVDNADTPTPLTATQMHQIHVGQELAHKLEVVRCLDELLLYHRRDPERRVPDDSKLVAALQGMLLTGFAGDGVVWLAQVLGWEQNAQAILPLMELKQEVDNKEKKKEKEKEKEGEKDEKEKEKTDKKEEKSKARTHLHVRQPAAMQYATMLLLLAMRRGGQPNLAEQCVDRVKAAVDTAAEVSGSTGSSAGGSKLHELYEWLRPYRAVEVGVSPETLSLWLEQVRQLAEERGDLAPALVSALRALRTLVLPPAGVITDQVPLRFDFALVELLSVDGLNILLKVAQRVADLLLGSWQRGLEVADARYLLALSTLEPVLQLVCALLQKVIRVRGPEYRDLTPLRTLFHIFGVFCSYPTAHQRYAKEISQLHRLVVDSLLAYTQTQLPEDGSEEVLDKSLWTLMLKELLLFTVNSPHSFLSGLTLMGELLPLPLPMPSLKITDSEISLEAEERRLQTARSLWAAHVLCLATELKDVLHVIGCTSNPLLQTALRRVFTQVCDLSASCATMIVRGALETFADSWERAKRESEKLDREKRLKAAATDASSAEKTEKPGESETKEVVADSTGEAPPAEGEQEEAQVPVAAPEAVVVVESIEVTRVFAAISLLVGIPAAKVVFLEALERGCGSEVVEDPVDRSARVFISAGSDVLRSPASNREQHTATQEAFISALHPLLDIDISVSSSGDHDQLQELSNSLPCAAYLQRLAADLLTHIHYPDQDMGTIHMALKALVMLAEHDHGFCLLARALEAATPGLILNLVSSVNNTFSKDNPDCLNTLLTTLELLRTLVITDTLEGEAMPLRSQAVSVGEIKSLLGWRGGDADHPVLDLHLVLKEYVKEESSLEGLLESIHSLITMLGDVQDGVNQELRPPSLPVRQTLTNLFSVRPLFAAADSVDSALDSLSEAHWLSAPWASGYIVPEGVAPGAAVVLEDTPESHEPETMRCDLENLAYTCCPGLNLRAEVERGVKGHEDEAVRHKKRRRGRDTIIATGRSHKKFVAPMRGRGFGLRVGQVPTTTTRGYDPFRQRPPNTSRPPSMHVDDFEKLEAEDADTESGGPTVIAKPSRSFQEDMDSGHRGRGRRGGMFASAYGGRSNDERFRVPPPFRPRQQHHRPIHARNFTK